MARDSNRCSSRAVSTETGSSEAHRVGQGPKRLLEPPWTPASFSSRQKSFTVFLFVGRARPSGAEGGRGAAGGGGGGKGLLLSGGGGGGGGGGLPESRGSGGGGGGTPFPASTDSMFSMSRSSSSPRSEKSRSPMQSLGPRVGSSWMGSGLGLGGTSGSLGSGSRLCWAWSRIRGAAFWGVLGVGTGSGEPRCSWVSGCPSTSSGMASASVSARPWASAACFAVSVTATFSRKRAL